MYQNYTCQFEDHNGEAIIGFCMNLDCNLPPQCYDRAIQLDPYFAYAFNNKGNSLYNLKLYDEAIKCYDRAIQLDPNFSKAYNNKGISLKNLQQYDEAIKCYDRAIQLDPNCAMAYQNKGIVLENFNNIVKQLIVINLLYKMAVHDKCQNLGLRNYKTNEMHYINILTKNQNISVFLYHPILCPHLYVHQQNIHKFMTFFSQFQE